MILLSLIITPAWAIPGSVYWGVLHEHSSLSRSHYEHSPDEVYENMRDRAGLDFGAVTDYDWALAAGSAWEDAIQATNRAHCPDGDGGCARPFVSILGYEWNNQSAPGDDEPNLPEWGHRNAYFIPAGDPEADYTAVSPGALDPCDGCASLVVSGEERDPEDGWQRYYDPCYLWSGLLLQDGVRAITIPHHPALSVTVWEGVQEGGPQKPASTDWSMHPADCALGLEDPEVIEPLVEIFSIWGNSERAGMALGEDPADGLADDERVVREVALSGTPRHRLGLIGSGDTHNGYPGEDPPHSFRLQPSGEFRGYTFLCAQAADCDIRFGHSGLVGIVVPEDQGLTRASVFEALSSRHTIATTGERMLLTTSLPVDGSERGIQGDDLTALNLARASEASLEIAVDLGELSLAGLSILAAGSDGLWVERALDIGEGGSSWSGELPLVEGGVVADWLPEGDLLLYLRAESAPRPAIEIPEDAPPFNVLETDGSRGLVQLRPGRYTSETMLAELERAFGESDLDLNYRFGYGELEPRRFHIEVSDGAIQLLFSESPDVAMALGFRDDGDTPPAPGSLCTPCLADVDIDGSEVLEIGWTSPIWLTYSPPTDSGDSGGADSDPPPADSGDSGGLHSDDRIEDSGGDDGGGGDSGESGGSDGCGCGVGEGLGGGLGGVLVTALFTLRRRRDDRAD